MAAEILTFVHVVSIIDLAMIAVTQFDNRLCGYALRARLPAGRSSMCHVRNTTIQRLATLYALSLWGKKGAFDLLRLQKTLFFADKNSGQPHFFTWKKWHYGQFSDGLSDSLNDLASAGCVKLRLRGDAVQSAATISEAARETLMSIFERAFPAWRRELLLAFDEWGYLPHTTILERAHDDDTFTDNDHGEEIFLCSLPGDVDLADIEATDIEDVLDLIDPKFQDRLTERLRKAVNADHFESDWRELIDSVD